MKIKKFENFINESRIEELLLESKVVFSKKFLNLLNRMRSNKIASDLIGIYSKDFTIQHNYIDITDNKEELSFTPDRKVQELISGRPEVYQVRTRRQLTHNSVNDTIFDALSYDRYRDYWTPESGQKGLIKAETVSSQSGKIFVIFEEITDAEEKRQAVLNKDCLSLIDYDDSQIYSTSRNPIRIGRLVRPLLRAAGISITDRELEEFTNQWKATYDFASDVLKQFDVVKSADIVKWYWYENYVDGGGTLNNSCMAEVSAEYLDIYSRNPQVSLVILYSDDGEIKDDKYTSEKIKGRALLWDCQISGNKQIFMDRIYTTFDSDVELFKQFAEKNGWYYKVDQSMEPKGEITNGHSKMRAEIRVDLTKCKFEYYPYCDTLCFLYGDDNFISNRLDDTKFDLRVLRSTEGEWYDEY